MRALTAGFTRLLVPTYTEPQPICCHLIYWRLDALQVCGTEKCNWKAISLPTDTYRTCTFGAETENRYFAGIGISGYIPKVWLEQMDIWNWLRKDSSYCQDFRPWIQTWDVLYQVRPLVLLAQHWQAAGHQHFRQDIFSVLFEILPGLKTVTFYMQSMLPSEQESLPLHVIIWQAWVVPATINESIKLPTGE